MAVEVSQEEKDLAVLFGKNKYDLSLALRVLKRYQLQPAVCNADVVAQVLYRSLAHFETADFATCLYLVPDKLHDSAELRILLKLEDFVERGQFKSFWEAYDGASKDGSLCVPKNSAVDLELRVAIVDALAKTFQKVPLVIVQGAVGTADVTGLLSIKAVGRIEGENVVFENTIFNTPPAVPAVKQITTTDIRTILHC